MSAFGPKQTSLVAPHMSAFGGKADMTVCGGLLSRSLLGVKRTCRFAAHMSAFDPKRTSRSDMLPWLNRYYASPGGLDDFPDLVDAVAFRHNHAGAVFEFALQHKLRLAV